MSQADFNNVFNTNAVGPYWLTFAFLPLLEAWRNSAQSNPAAAKFVPQIIMTSSINGWTKVHIMTSAACWILTYWFPIRVIGQCHERSLLALHVFEECYRSCHVFFGTRAATARDSSQWHCPRYVPSDRFWEKIDLICWWYYLIGWFQTEARKILFM